MQYFYVPVQMSIIFCLVVVAYAAVFVAVMEGKK